MNYKNYKAVSYTRLGFLPSFHPFIHPSIQLCSSTPRILKNLASFNVFLLLNGPGQICQVLFNTFSFFSDQCVVSIEFSPLSTVELTINQYHLHNGDYKRISVLSDDDDDDDSILSVSDDISSFGFYSDDDDDVKHHQKINDGVMTIQPSPLMTPPLEQQNKGHLMPTI